MAPHAHTHTLPCSIPQHTHTPPSYPLKPLPPTHPPHLPACLHACTHQTAQLLAGVLVGAPTPPPSHPLPPCTHQPAQLLAVVLVGAVHQLWLHIPLQRLEQRALAPHIHRHLIELVLLVRGGGRTLSDRQCGWSMTVMTWAKDPPMAE